MTQNGDKESKVSLIGKGLSDQNDGEPSENMMLWFKRFDDAAIPMSIVAGIIISSSILLNKAFHYNIYIYVV